nr:cullin-3 [Quercus suber]
MGVLCVTLRQTLASCRKHSQYLLAREYFVAYLHNRHIKPRPYRCLLSTSLSSSFSRFFSSNLSMPSTFASLLQRRQPRICHYLTPPLSVKRKDSRSSTGTCILLRPFHLVEAPAVSDRVCPLSRFFEHHSIGSCTTMADNNQQALHGVDVDFEEAWRTLEKAFREIHTKNASELSFEQLYRNAYRIVLQKRGGELYGKVAGFEEAWLGNEVRTSIVSKLTAPLLHDETAGRTQSTRGERLAAGQLFLKELKNAWEDHQLCMGMLTDVLMYMVCRLPIEAHSS